MIKPITEIGFAGRRVGENIYEYNPSEQAIMEICNKINEIIAYINEKEKEAKHEQEES